jgi:hypothetical protein
MTRRMNSRLTLLCLVFATGCAGSVEPSAPVASQTAELATTGCPTAHSWGPLSRLFWRTTRQMASAVWSSDGRQIGAVELIFEEKIDWNPLADTTDKQKFCHQLSIRDLQGHVSYVGPMQPNDPGEIMFMQPAGYFTVQSYVRDSGGGWDFHRVSVADGSRSLIGHVADGCQYGRALPSPDGKTIAYLAVAGHCNDGLSGNDVVVTFYDGATGQKLATSPDVSLPGGAFETWTPAGALVLSDGTKSVSVPRDGSASVTAPLPHCTDPGTTSSIVNADGRTLGFDDAGKIIVVKTDPSAAFGCQ